MKEERKYLFTFNSFEYFFYNDNFLRKSKKKTEAIPKHVFIQIAEIVDFNYKDYM